ncbi:efflux RND transporter permease subunit [Massilia cavernae]|uniref:RND family transporter n=1 Tax=Massilia cavernae TaxID=2320864 RepID=A0A418Y0S6_9BURK|nr:MMPL family transporter [Massilia cavernae]RJG18907.1 RND family transporter [Massilia cavernae]
MTTPSNQFDTATVIADQRDFDKRSGSFLERLIFNYRQLVMVLVVLATGFLAFKATTLEVNASFDKLMPQSHPYIRNYLANQKDLHGLGNSLRVVVENTQGDIYDPEFLDAMRKINDKLYLIRGVNRPAVKSVWMSAVRWNEVTEEGYQGGAVMPPTYDGSAESIAQLRTNIGRANLLGSLVANDMRSAMIVAPVLERYGDTGERIDYGQLGRDIEAELRDTASTLVPGKPGKVKVYVVGFGKLAGDLIEGLREVMTYFAIAAAIAAALIYGYTRCIRSTALVLSCSMVAVIWQLGLIRLFGFELDPYSMLVPFLVFAIGVSHGAQKMNGIMQDVGRGIHKYVAARYTFRRLFLAGVTALLADVVGFAVLSVIDIPVIRDLAITASIGVSVLVITNLILIPILLSYTGVSATAARRSLQLDKKAGAGQGIGGLWNLLDRFTERRWALPTVIVSAVLAIGGFAVSLNLQIGDLEQGAPELRANSRYNLDNAYITAHYGLSSDQFAVIVKTPSGGCEKSEVLMDIDRLDAALRAVEGVQTTTSLADSVVKITSGLNEASPKWLTVSHNQDLNNTGVIRAQDANPELINSDCSVTPVVAYLADHRAATLERVLAATEQFAAGHDREAVQFLPAAGSAGIEAVTNIVVKKANTTMLLLVYLAVIVLCLITFRNWRATVVTVLPLMLTSILCEALMVYLGMGVKVATLPVIALGVGIGVDYALYLVSVQLDLQRRGATLAEAYRGAVQFTGKVVVLVGVTLAAGVVTWAFSPIKFQADMGILLTFMFMWNMIGAMILIPALSYFLLQKVPQQVPQQVPSQAGGVPATAH